MKHLFILLGAVLSSVLLGCSGITQPESNPPPAAPQGLRSINGDHQITLEWEPVQDPDLAGYYIYCYSKFLWDWGWWMWILATKGDENFEYKRVGQVPASTTRFLHQDLYNGITYIYRVSAFDTKGKEGPRSPYILDTPRDEGYGVKLWAAREDWTGGEKSENESGFIFLSAEVCPWYGADILFWYGEGEKFPMMYVNDGWIQEYGPVKSLQELQGIDQLPKEGWKSKIRLSEGYAYIVYIPGPISYHYAALRVTELGEDAESYYVVFDWVYQPDHDNPQL